MLFILYFESACMPSKRMSLNFPTAMNLCTSWPRPVVLVSVPTEQCNNVQVFFPSKWLLLAVELSSSSADRQVLNHSNSPIGDLLSSCLLPCDCDSFFQAIQGLLRNSRHLSTTVIVMPPERTQRGIWWRRTPQSVNRICFFPAPSLELEECSQGIVFETNTPQILAAIQPRESFVTEFCAQESFCPKYTTSSTFVTNARAPQWISVAVGNSLVTYQGSFHSGKCYISGMSLLFLSAHVAMP